MKKLMIAAVAICTAAFVQAATCNWYAENIYTYATPTSSDLNTGYAVYFFETSTVAQGAATTAIASGNWDFLANGFSDDAVDSGEAYGTSTWHGNGDPIEGYYIVFNNADAEKADHYFMSALESGAIGGSGQAANLSWDGSASATASNWVQVAPEPTSGLLLLIGMAGLALRRRRA